MEKLGIEPNLLIAQIVNFVIIMLVLTKLLYKPLGDMLEKRKKKIEEGLALTESMKLEEEKLEVKKDKVIAQARDDGKALIEEAKKQAKEEAKVLLEDARKEAESVLDKARREIENEREAMQKSVNTEAVKIAESMARKVLVAALGDKAAHDVVAKQIQGVAKLKTV